jgi:hypothetical protein
VIECVCLALRLTFAYYGRVTITFRIDEQRRGALRKRAAALGKSESELLRDLIDREISMPTVAERAGNLIGCLTLDPKRIDSDPWRKTIRQNNWRE